MPDDKPVPPGTVEVDKHVMREGKVVFKLSGPPPRKVKMVCDAIIYFCAGLGGIVGATDIFTGYQAKVIGLTLSCVILLCGAIQKALGVEVTEPK